MEDTGGTLTVVLKQIRMETGQVESLELEPGIYACLTVKDTGIGIERGNLEKIFNPYFTTKGKDKGTGLGLSVVHGIVKGYGGDIQINSEAGKGTEAYVYLPIVESKIEHRAKEVGNFISEGTERILLVDDEEAIVRLEQQMLEKLGYEVIARTGSFDALEAFKANPDRYDLIVTDMTMPNMTGIKLSKEIKKIRPEIPVIICTGFSEKIDGEKCKALGIQGYVMKPIVRNEFAGTIREVIDKTVVAEHS
jgi:CheY-like chemotaxis protein